MHTAESCVEVAEIVSRGDEAVKSSTLTGLRLCEDINQLTRQKFFVDGPALYKCLSLGRGRMRVVQRSGPGYYPIAMIPGQFVDSYKVNGIKISLHLRVIFLECLPTKCNNWGRANVILGILFSKGYCGSGSDTLVYQ